MRCPSCDSEIEEGAATCRRCGAAADVSQAAATAELESEPGGGTAQLYVGDHEERTPSPTEGEEPQLAPAAAGRDFWLSLRRLLAAGGWLDAAAGAGVAFFAILLTGAVLALAMKLQGASLGARPGVTTALSATVILALGVLRVPIHIGDLHVIVIPLGAFIAAGAAIAWASATTVRGRDSIALDEQMREGAKVGVPLALVCFVSALVFKIPAARADVTSGPFHALIFGGLWGALFGALGGAAAHRSLRALIVDRWRQWQSRSLEAAAGVAGATMMIGCAGVLAVLVALIWIIVALATGAGRGGLTPSVAAAALIYLVAFAPNLLVLIIGLSLGAPVAAGTAVTLNGRVMGTLEEYSLFGWAEDSPPWYVFLLVLVPLLSCAFGGFVARRLAGRNGDPIKILAVAALTFALTLVVLALLAEARLGAELVRERGFALLAVRPIEVGLSALLWASIAGFAGWRVADATTEPAA